MARLPRLLFPELPPELRNEVYNYLSASEMTSKASIVGLPLKLKMYECKHTIVRICPVHNGSTGLLALQTYRLEEALEYGSWLLNNAIELRMEVVFKGRVNTFVQQDWDKKMEAHLRKLAKLHPWLKKVAKYDIQIRWSPIDGILKSRKNRKVAGQIVKDMATMLTALVDDDVKKRRGEMAVKLHLAHGIAAETVFSGTRFGFAEFLLHPGSNLDGFKRQTIEVWKEAYRKPLDTETGSLLQPILPAKQDEKSLLVAEKGSVAWAIDTKRNLIIRKRLVDDRVMKVTTGGEEEQDMGLDYVIFSLLGECMGQR